MDVKLFSFGYDLNLGVPPLGLAYLNSSLNSAGYESDIVLFEGLELEVTDCIKDMKTAGAEIPSWNLMRRAEKFETILNTACFGGLGLSCEQNNAHPKSQGYEGITDSLEKMAEKLTGSSVVCISVYPTSIGVGMYIANAVKAADPEVKVVMGGPAADVFRWVMAPPNGFYAGLKQQAIESRTYGGFVKLLQSSVDYLVHGEGESTLLDIVASFSSGKPRDDIPQASIFRDGRCITNPPRPLIDLDSLPNPEFSSLDLSLYSRLSFHLSRGCFNSCKYCDERVYWGGKIRIRNPRNVVEELRQHSEKYGTRYFIACDSLLNGDRGKLIEFCGHLSESSLKIDYVGSIFLPTADNELFDRLAESGFTKAFYGVETMNPSILKSMNKAQSPDDVRRKIGYSTSVGIKAGLNIILGYPGSTVETEMETLRNIRDLGDLGTWVGMNVADVRLRSPLLDNPREYGFDISHTDRIDPKRWSDASLMHCFIPGAYTYVRNSLSRSQLDKVYEEYVKEGLSIDFDYKLNKLGLDRLKAVKRILPRRLRAKVNLMLKRQLAEKFR